MSNETDRIRNDLANIKKKILDMAAGRIGVVPESYHHVAAGAAWDNQRRNLLATQERLETELVVAMLNRGWAASEIIRRMSLTLAEVETSTPVDSGGSGTHTHPANTAEADRINLYKQGKLFNGTIK